MRPPYRTIENAIQLTFSPTAGGSRTAILASTRSTIVAGVLLYVVSMCRLGISLTRLVLYLRAQPSDLAPPHPDLQFGHLLVER